MMRLSLIFFLALVASLSVVIDCALPGLANEATPFKIVPAKIDLDEVNDAKSLDIQVLQNWMPSPRDESIEQKLIEITVCEWWPGQEVRIPVTLLVPAKNEPCKYLIVGNMGLAKKAAMPNGAILRLLKEHGVGVVLVGMGTIDAMEPEGKLHIGMKSQFLKTGDARYTQAWIWGMSDMRAITAVCTEETRFQPTKILVTGGSKRGVASAVAGIFDPRVTAIMPVVAPPLGNPGGAYVIGTDSPEVLEANREFLAEPFDKKHPELPATALKALVDRQERRAMERLTLDEVQLQGWSDADIQTANNAPWDVCRVAKHWAKIQERGVQVFYNVGTNDNVSPDLVTLGKHFPDFPIYIVPGGQHGGPATSGFTIQVPSLKAVDENLYSFASLHFFGARSMFTSPQLSIERDRNAEKIKVIVKFADLKEPKENQVHWSIDRHAPYTLAYEYDRWQTAELHRVARGTFSATIPLSPTDEKVQIVSTHADTENDLTLHYSSALVESDKP